MMRLICFLPALMYGIGTMAQNPCNYELRGIVLDLETKDPIPFVTVRIVDQTTGAITDESGAFELTELCSPEFDLVVSHVGYKTTVHHHDSYHPSPTIFLASDDHLLESVVVEGEYNPTGLHTIDLRQLSAMEFDAGKSETFGDLAGRLPGVSVITTGQNIVKPIIHGLHSNRVLIVNNGVRHEFQNWGVEHAPEIDPSQAGSLEVVKGAATVRYGPDALGGVILINPPAMELSSGFEGSVGVTGKTNGRAGEADLRIQQGWKNLVVAGQGSMVRQGDMHSPDYLLTNTGKEEESLSGAFRFHKGSFDLEGYYSRFHQNLGILRASVNGSLEDLQHAMESTEPPGTSAFSYRINSPRQEVNHHLMKLRGSMIRDNQDLTVQYAFQTNHRMEFDVRRGSNNEVPSIDLRLSSQSLDIDWNHPDMGRLQGQAGAQWLYQDNNNIPGTNTVPFIPNYNNTRIGLFLIERLEHEKMTYEAGLRYDYQYSSVRGREPDQQIYRNSLSYSQVTGSLGMKRAWSDHLTLRSNLGVAWRPPNISELYSFGKHQASIEYGLWRYLRDEHNQVTAGAVLTEDDRPVHPETGFKWINSLDWQSKRSQWEITAYANWISNFIYTRPAGITSTVRGSFPYFVYEQDNALFIGSDLAWSHELNHCWNLQSTASYVWAKEVTHRQTFVSIPPARLDARLSYNRKPDFLTQSSLSLGMSYVFRYFQQPRVITIQELIDAGNSGASLFEEDDSMFDFMTAPDPYLLTNLSWTATAGRFQWAVQVKNLFDVRYRVYTDRLRYFADQTGRNFQLSLMYTIR